MQTIVKTNWVDALKLAFIRLNPKYQLKNPVMFVVFVGACLTSIIFLQNLFIPSGEPIWFIGQVTFWLWFTIIFANFSERSCRFKLNSSIFVSEYSLTYKCKPNERQKQHRNRLPDNGFFHGLWISIDLLT